MSRIHNVSEVRPQPFYFGEKDVGGVVTQEKGAIKDSEEESL